MELYRYYRGPLSQFKSSTLKLFDESFGAFDGSLENAVDLLEAIELFQQTIGNAGVISEEKVVNLLTKANTVLKTHGLSFYNDEEEYVKRSFCSEFIRFFTKLWQQTLKNHGAKSEEVSELIDHLDLIVIAMRYLGKGQELATELGVSDTLYCMELANSQKNLCVVCSLNAPMKCGKYSTWPSRRSVSF